MTSASQALPWPGIGLTGQLLDICQLQSSIQIFAAKYPESNLLCGIQVDQSQGFRWQAYGPGLGRAEVQNTVYQAVERQLGKDGGNLLDAQDSESKRLHLLKSFVEAAAEAGIVSGVQVALLLDLAKKFSPPEAPSETHYATPEHRYGSLVANHSADVRTSVGTNAVHIPEVLETVAAYLQQQQQSQELSHLQQQQFMLQQHNSQQQQQHSAPTGKTEGCAATASRARVSSNMQRLSDAMMQNNKPRKTKYTDEQLSQEFSAAQVQAILDSIKTHYALHPSRYTEFVVRDMKERYPELELDSAAVRKLKFRVVGKPEGSAAGDAQTSPGASPALPWSSFGSSLTPQALAQLQGLVGLMHEGMHDGSSASVLNHLRAQLGKADVSRDLSTSRHDRGRNSHLHANPNTDVLLRAAEHLAANTEVESSDVKRQTTSRSLKRARLSQDQMASLVESVKQHAETCPERYTQLVISDMREKYPDLQLNKAQIRKVKFRNMGGYKKGPEKEAGEGESNSDTDEEDEEVKGEGSPSSPIGEASGVRAEDKPDVKAEKQTRGGAEGKASGSRHKGGDKDKDRDKEKD